MDQAIGSRQQAIGVGRIRKFGALSWEEQLLFSEAFFLHISTGLILKVIPFRWIPRAFGSRQFESPTQEKSRTRSVGKETQSRIRQLADRDGSLQSERMELIRAAIQRAELVSPWRNRCLISSLAARCMLRRREIHSRLYLGVAKESGGKLIAHAWLVAGDTEIVPKGGAYQQLYLF